MHVDHSIRVCYLDANPDGATEVPRADGQFELEVVESLESSLAVLDEIDCVVCVHRPPAVDALALLEAVEARRPGLPVVVYAPEGDPATGQEALAAGAADWLPVAPGAEAPAVFANRIESAVERGARSPEHLEETLERITDAFFALDSDWRFTYANEQAEKLLDRPEAELLGEVIWEAFPEAVDTTFHAEYERAMETQRPADFEEYYSPLDTWFAVRAYPSETGLSVYFRDVTGRKHREQELEQYRVVTEAASDAIVVVDESSTVVSANPAVRDVFGYEPEALEGESITALMDDESARGHLAAMERYLDSGERSVDWDYVEFSGRHRDGSEVPLAVSLDEYEHAGERYFVGVIRDNTERKRRERELEQYETMVETVGDGVYVVDPDARFTFVNDALVAMAGYDRDQLLGEHASTLVPEGARARAGEMVAEMLAGERREGVIETELHTADGGTIPIETRIVPFPFGDGDYGRVGVVRDVTERRRFERTLTALHEATREMVRAESRAEVCEIAVETATRVLDLSGVGVFLYDSDRNVLHPEHYSADADVLHGEVPEIRPGESLTGHVFVTGETLVVDDVDEAERLEHNSTSLRSGVFVPLGDHGVLISASTDVGAFDDRTIQLVDLLAATTEATLDRVTREEELRERERELGEQATRLERLAHLTEKLRAVERALVTGQTREGIEEAVCEALADTERYEFAWIGEPDRRDGTVTPRAWAGDARSYLDSVEVAIDDDPTGEPAGQTAATGEATLVPDVADRLREAPWRGEALSNGLRSALSIPIEYNEVTYGVLTVYASEANGFDELGTDVFEELAETVAFAINGAETRHALVADRVVELELVVREGEGILLEIARDADCQVEFEGEVPSTEGGSHVFFTARGAPHERIVDAAEAVGDVAGVEVVAGESDERLYRATVAGPTVAREFASLGAMLQAITAVSDEARIVVELPRTSDVRAFVTGVQSRYPGAQLVARRERSRPTLTRRGLVAELEGQLTDRQQEALRTAYLSGFFESPRATTGVELGGMLGISQPTFTAHLRAAERKLLGLVFGEEAGVALDN